MSSCFSEADVKRRLHLSDADLRNSELLMHLGARGTAEPGVMVFPRETVERAELWLSERQEAAERGAELMLNEAGDHHPSGDGRQDARSKADALALEMTAAGFDIGAPRREES